MTTAEALKIIGEMSTANARVLRQAERAADAFLEAIARSQDRMLSRMNELIADAPNFKSLSTSARLKWYTSNADALNQAYYDSGYLKHAKAFADRYEELAKLSTQIMKAGKFDAAFTKIPKEYLRFLQRRTYDRFAFLGDEAIAKLDGTILDMALGGYSKPQMLAELKGVITGSYNWGTRTGMYEWHAGTYARTASTQTTRRFMNEMADKAEAEDFTYLGPVDSKTRAFCFDHVGRVYKKEVVLDMDNGMTGDTFTDGGGWNCRHQWIALVAEVADAVREQVFTELAA